MVSKQFGDFYFIPFFWWNSFNRCLSEDSHFVTASVQDSKQRTITEMFQTSFTADDEDSLLEATNDWDDSPSGNTSGP